MALIFVDVEAVGQSPIKGKMTEFGAVEFKSKATFHGVMWESHPDLENPAQAIITGEQRASVGEVMQNFATWLKQVSNSRPVFVSDNPAYDFQWINAAFDSVDMVNPFGHSGRRISDFWAGLKGDFYQTQDWKSYRRTPHDHNPVNDAMGNVEAFETILKENRPH
jgi:hypothetical protein